MNTVLRNRLMIKKYIIKRNHPNEMCYKVKVTTVINKKQIFEAQIFQSKIYVLTMFKLVVCDKLFEKSKQSIYDFFSLNKDFRV